MKYIGFDIGGTKCAVSIGEEKDGILKILDKKVIPTDFNISPYEMIDKMCVIADEFSTDFEAVGISCGGPLNSQKGIIMSPPNLIGWDNIEIVDYIKNKLKKEAYLENDANACALAEWKYGAGENCKNMVFFTFGTGLGAGLILNGQLYRGASDMAGEAGHIRLYDTGPVGYGKAGSFEGFCSGGGIAQLGKTKALEKFQQGKKVSYCENIEKMDSISAKIIAEYADKGFEDAKEIYNLCGEMLGKGLSVIIDILNPEKIIIGSIFKRCEHLLRNPMENVLKKECLSLSKNACEILPAKLSENIGDYAALSVATNGGESI